MREKIAFILPCNPSSERNLAQWASESAYSSYPSFQSHISVLVSVRFDPSTQLDYSTFELIRLNVTSRLPGSHLLLLTIGRTCELCALVISIIIFNKLNEWEGKWYKQRKRESQLVEQSTLIQLKLESFQFGIS